jgi:dihydroxyacid dehydratase/phosphogluconate dehydratase
MHCSDTATRCHATTSSTSSLKSSKKRCVCCAAAAHARVTRFAQVEAAGGKAFVHYPIVISDGETNGTPGMKYSLVSREVIADSIEVRIYVAVAPCKTVTLCRSCTKATSLTQ